MFSHYKVLIYMNDRYSDHGFIGKNLENDSTTPFTVFPIYHNLKRDGLICKLHNGAQLVASLE